MAASKENALARFSRCQTQRCFCSPRRTRRATFAAGRPFSWAAWCVGRVCGLAAGGGERLAPAEKGTRVCALAFAHSRSHFPIARFAHTPCLRSWAGPPRPRRPAPRQRLRPSGRARFSWGEQGNGGSALVKTRARALDLPAALPLSHPGTGRTAGAGRSFHQAAHPARPGQAHQEATPWTRLSLTPLIPSLPSLAAAAAFTAAIVRLEAVIHAAPHLTPLLPLTAIVGLAFLLPLGVFLGCQAEFEAGTRPWTVKGYRAIATRTYAAFASKAGTTGRVEGKDL